VPTFADSTSTDDTTHDDPIVRAAAVSALGRYNGAVVAVDPGTGRILTVVNQKLAFGEGYIPARRSSQPSHWQPWKRISSPGTQC
jgi:hypothetical protein